MNTTTTDPQGIDSAGSQAGPASPSPAGRRPARPLSRPVHDRMLGGVASGIARYLGIDVTVVRIVLAVLAVIGGAGVPIYVAGWLLIPEEGCEQSIASSFIDSFQARSR